MDLDAKLPEDLNATLRDYQKEGFNWLSFLKETQIGGILADDMGLGKTIQALCILEHQSLVVAPTSVLHNWICRNKKVSTKVIHLSISWNWSSIGSQSQYHFDLLRNPS